MQRHRRQHARCRKNGVCPTGQCDFASRTDTEPVAFHRIDKENLLTPSELQRNGMLRNPAAADVEAAFLPAYGNNRIAVLGIEIQ